MPVAAKGAQLWDTMYAKGARVPWEPAEDVVRFCARHIQMRVGPTAHLKHRPCERILDLGCGNGRHVLYFARQGFKVSGVDISNESLALCRRWLSVEGLTADLRCTSIDALSDSDAAYDVVVSYGVLDHVTKSVALAAIEEVKRVLKRGGLFHLNLRSWESFDFGKGEEIEPRTFLLTDGPEQGLPQHFWTGEEIEELLVYFTVLNWEFHVRWLDKSRTTRDARWAISLQWPTLTKRRTE